AEYLTYADGEGRLIQAYRFASAAIGTWTASLANTSAIPIAYRLELWTESDLILDAAVDPSVIDPLEEATISARLARIDGPVLDADVEAWIVRPDGSLELVTLADDGAGVDPIAGDGIYHATVPPTPRSGVQVIQVVATDGPDGSFTRTTTLELVVRSDAAELGDSWESSLSDADGDGLPDLLMLAGEITTHRPGVFLVNAEIASSEGAVLSSAGA